MEPVPRTSYVEQQLTARASPRNAAIRQLIAVLLAIPHRLDRELIQFLLASRPGFVVTAAVGTRSDLKAAASGPRPDVVFLELTGPATVDRPRVVDVRHYFPGVPVLAATPHDQEECPILRLARQRAASGGVGEISLTPDCLAVAVMQGAHGAIRRTGSIDEFCAALLRVANGATWFDDGLSERLARWTRLSRRKTGRPLLSPREVDVARRIVGGHSNKEIAAQLGLSEPTVKKHVGHLMEKLELSDRLQLGLFLVGHRFLLEKTLRRPPASRPR
jgi:DNA-binding NarL/FixJ family response regulator